MPRTREESLEYHHIYNASERGRERARRYSNSEKGKVRNYRYNHSPKGATRRIRFSETEKRRLSLRKYNNSPKGKETWKQWYYRVQDEACFYHDSRTFVWGLRFIQALKEVK